MGESKERKTILLSAGQVVGAEKGEHSIVVRSKENW